MDSTQDGFLIDARRAWTCAETEKPKVLGWQVCAALCESSVASVGANVPSDLLVAGLKASAINPRLAQMMAQSVRFGRSRVLVLSALAERLPAEEQLAVLTQALDAVRAIDVDTGRWWP